MFVRYVAAQGIIVWARQQYVDVAGNPGEEVELALSNPPPTLLASTTVRLASSGRGLAEFLDADSDPLRIRVGMVVESSLAVDADVLAPDISVVINKTADTVMANCGRGWLPTGVLVTARTRDLSKRVTRTGFADGSGAFLANFRVAPAYNIVAGDKIDVYCKQDSGDIVAQTFTVG